MPYNSRLNKNSLVFLIAAASTDSCLGKLEMAGYLKRSRLYEGGKVIDWLYEFCDQPVFRAKNLVTENREIEENLVTDFLEVGFVEVENLKVENRENNKQNSELKTKELNTFSNPSTSMINHKIRTVTPLQLGFDLDEFFEAAVAKSLREEE